MGRKWLKMGADPINPLRYAPDEGDGWLNVVREDTESIIELPAFLQVKIERTDGKREYFTIIERKRWMEIYSTLIKARKGDFMSVGILEVID